MSQETVTYTVDGALGIIAVDNPPVNALSHAVRAGLMAALEQAREDDTSAVLLYCRGRTFIAGADIREFGKPMESPSLPEVIAVLEAFPKPVTAALHGTALGGGLEVAMACHFRCAVPAARLGLPEVNLGLLPGAGGTQRLPRLIGVEAALDMMLSGSPMAAPKALDAGLVDELVDGEFPEAASAVALARAGGPPRRTGELPPAAAPDAAVFDEQRKRMARRRRGQIAPGHIIDLVEIATREAIDAGQAAERERFLECRDSPQSSALRHVFFAERATGRLPDIGKETPALEVGSAGVIGAGTMGAGIALCLADAGIPVTLLETSEENLGAGLDRIRSNYAAAVKRGRLAAEAVDERMALISGTTDYADLAAVDAVIEAVFENMAIKQEVFRQLDATCKADCMLASNTSYLDINVLAAETSRPGRVIGAHFFSPAHVMKLLEVVRGDATEPAVVKSFMTLARRIGKIPVAVGVCQGFVGNRMLRAYARQAQLLLLEGATPQAVDSAMEAWGMAMGPLAVGDLAGLDIGYRSRRDQGIEPGSVREHALADRLVEEGRLGQKAGRGYYRYPDGKRTPDPEVEQWLRDVAADWKVPQRDIDAEEIQERLILALVNEGAAILDEGIAARPSDIDVVWINGYGFPAWRGGPMYHGDAVGTATVVEKMRALHAKTGDDFWEPAPLLQRLASEAGALSSMN